MAPWHHSGGCPGFKIRPWMHHCDTYYLPWIPLPAASRPPRRWGSSTHPCWYSCLFSSLEPAAATAGETEALSGSVGQTCWETDICLGAVSSRGAMRGHLWLPLDQHTHTHTHRGPYHLHNTQNHVMLSREKQIMGYDGPSVGQPWGIVCVSLRMCHFVNGWITVWLNGQ